ncbi:MULTISPECIES: hypothetical protein [Desulforamulus]|uniref:Uncharacterized protein n=2 Tax=Desulforamulus TaxID=2916693 RepID=K8DWU1_9FIRM|nr:MULTISPECIES: hypothetical protein [Desulforamulus]AQS59636.1 hypothetical protein B0537_11435 [Desulforamulus ferrireducens]CCO06850.1 conserved exported hypothetical protein [Desulforamulus hydrothermalis Lam5 = DSM 18033]SHH44433.1 hypothetical protein SAMN02745177_02571 [Desulforamulus hydrothermalis Lam5 = DSM 18033]
MNWTKKVLGLLGVLALLTVALPLSNVFAEPVVTNDQAVVQTAATTQQSAPNTQQPTTQPNAPSTQPQITQPQAPQGYYYSCCPWYGSGNWNSPSNYRGSSW